MSFNRKEDSGDISIQEALDPFMDAEQITDKARIKMKGKSAKASAKRNRGGKQPPAPVSSGDNKGGY
jgi:hypothetical protein